MLDLTGGPCVAKRLSGCGSGTEYLAVTPWGDLYPCHQFVGEEKYLMGNVDEGLKRTDIRDEFKECTLRKNAGTASQNSTAAADVRQTPINSTAPLMTLTISAVNWSASVWSAQS